MERIARSERSRRSRHLSQGKSSGSENRPNPARECGFRPTWSVWHRPLSPKRDRNFVRKNFPLTAFRDTGACPESETESNKSKRGEERYAKLFARPQMCSNACGYIQE
jgi:hypothetical protein